VPTTNVLPVVSELLNRRKLPAQSVCSPARATSQAGQI